jgi:beta-glucanase (GH16 family)
MATRPVSPPLTDPPLVGRRVFIGVLGTTLLALVGCAPVGPAPSATTPSASSTPNVPSASQWPAIPGRKLIWSQEFEGPEWSLLSADEWTAENSGSGFGNDELEAYTPRPENVSLDGEGSLRIRALLEDHTDPEGREREYTSGRVETEHLFRYGRIEARVKVPTGQGLWSAFWLIGEYRDGTEWPATGEIDVMEYVNETQTLHANGWGDNQSGGPWWLPGTLAVDPGFAQHWHIYSVEWSEDQLEFAVDDEVYHRIHRDDLDPSQIWRFDRPHAIILNLAVGGRFPGAVGDSSNFPAEVLVDHVRVYDSEVSKRIGW